MLHEGEDGEIPNTDEAEKDYEDGFEDGSNRKDPRKPDNPSYMMGYQNGKNILSTLEGFV